jgi:hypothetical protein
LVSWPGFGSISGSTLFGTTPGSAGTYFWTLRATDQENQISDKSFSMSVVNPVQYLHINITGYWYPSNEAGGSIYISMFSLQAPGPGGTAQFTSGTQVGRPNPTIYISSTTTIEVTFPDFGTLSASVYFTQGTITFDGTSVSYSQVIAYSNGTFWYR